MFLQSPSDDAHYDIVIIGSGFGSLFYLSKYLLRRPRDRALVLERGGNNSHAWQIANKKNSPILPDSTFDNSLSSKPWNFTIGLGGGANCWFAQTPRFHPSDFKLKSLYHVGRDWPVTYDEIEPHYNNVERYMAVSGSESMAQIIPRSEPFPQPPHHPSSVDQVMLSAQPDYHFIMPTARARVSTATRPACCATSQCNLCPIDAKFSANNGFKDLFTNPNVEILLHANVVSFRTDASAVQAVEFEHGSRTQSVTGDLFVLGANAIHSPAILLRSGLNGPFTGRGLHEQIGFELEVLLDGLDNFDGSTITTGLNYSMYDGDFRARHAGSLIYFDNRMRYGLRKEFGRWRQSLPLVIVSEDIPSDDNRVLVDANGNPKVVYKAFSAYAEAGKSTCIENLESILSPLPVEKILYRADRLTESHVQGTLRMGIDESDSEVDRHQIHHKMRNLVVVGSAVFPTCSNANPSLTVAALSDRAAELHT